MYSLYNDELKLRDCFQRLQVFKDNAMLVEPNYHVSIVVQTRIALIFSFEVIILTKLRLSTFVISYSNIGVEF